MAFYYNHDDYDRRAHQHIPPKVASAGLYYHSLQQQLLPVPLGFDNNAYHFSLPKRKVSDSHNKVKLSRSLSTGNLKHAYDQQEHFIHQEPYAEEEHNWYYQHYNKPPNSSSLKISPSKRKKNRTKSKNYDESMDIAKTLDGGSDDHNTEYNIDPDVYTDIDGEPMNELELLAAKNAILNETIFYNEADDMRVSLINNEIVAEHQQTSKRALRDSIRSIDDGMVDDNLLNAIKSLNLAQMSTEEAVDTVEDSSLNDEAVPEPTSSKGYSNGSSGVSGRITDDTRTTTTATTAGAKKKRWPFSFLFKKGRLLPTGISQQQQLTSPHLKIHSSTSTPPTPALSPDYYSQKATGVAVSNYNHDGSILSSSSRSSLLSVSPFQQQGQFSNSPQTNKNEILNPVTTTKMNDAVTGCWLFRYSRSFSLTPDVWFRFDPENQKKISEYLQSMSLQQANIYPLHQFRFNSNNTSTHNNSLHYQQPRYPYDMLQFTDSHIGNNSIPVVIFPLQKVGYYATDTHANHLGCLEINYIPSSLQKQ